MNDRQVKVTQVFATMLMEFLIHPYINLAMFTCAEPSSLTWINCDLSSTPTQYVFILILCELQWQIRMEEYFFVILIIRILTEMNYWIQSQWNVHCHTYLDKRKNVTDVQHVFSLSCCYMCFYLLLTSHKKKAEWLACAGWMQISLVQPIQKRPGDVHHRLNGVSLTAQAMLPPYLRMDHES